MNLFTLEAAAWYQAGKQETKLRFPDIREYKYKVIKPDGDKIYYRFDKNIPQLFGQRSKGAQIAFYTATGFTTTFRDVPGLKEFSHTDPVRGMFRVVKRSAYTW